MTYVIGENKPSCGVLRLVRVYTDAEIDRCGRAWAEGDGARMTSGVRQTCRRKDGFGVDGLLGPAIPRRIAFVAGGGSHQTTGRSPRDMNASAIGTATRAVGLVIVIVLAATVGLMVGNALQGRGATNAGYPEGWAGGAAVPLSRTADTSFSLDAIGAVQAARGDAAAPARPAYADYGLRHRQAKADDSDKPTKETLAKPTLR
jgi:hypothetical protein